MCSSDLSSEDLDNLVACIQASGADIVKIATTALDITDVSRVFQITVHSHVRGVSGVTKHYEHLFHIMSPFCMKLIS